MFNRNKFAAGGVKQPAPTGPVNADEIEQKKKMEQRARRFAPLPVPTGKALSASGTVKLGTKRPSDQGIEGDGEQTAAKQMRFQASRKVVAKARANVVQQRQNLMQQRQQQVLQQLQQQKSVVAPPSSASSAQRIPASQRLGTKSVQQQQQPVSSSQKTTPTSTPRPSFAPRPIRPVSDVSYIHRYSVDQKYYSIINILDQVNSFGVSFICILSNDIGAIK